MQLVHSFGWVINFSNFTCEEVQHGTPVYQAPEAEVVVKQPRNAMNLKWDASSQNSSF